jgi:hypothetical protein
MSHTFFFTREFLAKNHMTVVPHVPYFQAMLNTLTEQDFQDAFTNQQKHWEWCICAEGDYFEGDGGQHAPS